jgi:hypothetical protein
VIGSRLTDKAGAVFEVAAQSQGHYVLHRVDEHEPPQEVTAAELAARFNLDASDPSPEVDEQAGWEALADANERAAIALARGDVADAPTPEETLAVHAD